MPACTISWDGGGDGVHWRDAANWSGDTLPGSADHVCIGPGFSVDHDSGDETILSLRSAGTLTLSGGTLSLTYSADESTATTFIQSGGTLRGAATLAVTGSYDWTFGTQQGSGVTRIGSGATLTKSGGFSTSLVERTLRVEGTAMVTGSFGIQTSQGATIETTAGGSFDFRSDADLSTDFSAPAERFLNAGTLKKTAGGLISSITLEVDNDGTVLAGVGTLSLGGGDGAGAEETGTFTAAAGATLEFGGGVFTLAPGSSVSGSGTVQVAGGDVSFGGSYSVAGTTAVAGGFARFEAAATTGSVTHSNGTLAGAGTLLVTGSYDWTFGTQQGSGVTRIGSGATLTKSGGFSTSLVERTLRVEGTAMVTGSFGIQTSQGATIETTAGGSFDFRSDADLSTDFSAPAERFLNAGTLKKTAGGLISSITLEVDNDGTVLAGVGTLSLGGGDGAGAEETGTFTAAAGATLEFGGGVFTLAPGSSVSGSGTVQVAGGDVSFGGSYSVAGTTAVAGGFARFEAAATTGSVTHSNGTLAGAGTLLVTGSYDWTFGTQQGSGVTRIGSGATLTKSGGFSTSLVERTLRVEGTAMVTGSFGIQTSQGATIETTAGGSFDFRSDADLSTDFSAPAERFLNAGTLTKSAGASASGVAMELVNSGTVSAGAGSLQLSGGDGSGAQSGSFAGTGAAGNVAFSGGDWDLGAGTSLDGRVELAGAVLTVLPGVTVPAVTFRHSNGTLAGAGTLLVTGSYDWTFGTQQGSGVTRIGSGATLTKSGGFSTSLVERTLRVEGTAMVTGSFGIQTSQGATIETTAGGSFDFRSDADLSTDFSAPAERFLNAGTLTKSAGASASGVAMELVNSGTVSAGAGSLQLSGGDGSGAQSGSFAGTGAAGNVAFSGGDWDLGAGTSLDGRVELAGAVLTVLPGVTVPAVTFRHSNGTLAGAGTLLVTGSYDWTFGTQQGSGVTRIGSGATLTKSGGFSTSLVERTLRVEGTAMVTGSFGIQTSQGATIETTAGGSFDFRSDADLSTDFSAPAERFLNAGTLTKSAGASASGVAMELENSGVVEARSGTLSADTLTNWSAATKTLTGGTYLVSATFRFSGADIAGNAATIVLDGPTAAITDTAGLSAFRNFATNAAAGDLTIKGGKTLTASGAFTNTGLVTVEAASTFGAVGAFTNAGTVRGTGTVAASIANNGRVTPGLSPGILHVDGPYAASSGTLAVEIGGTTPGTGHDQLDVTGAVTLGGTLEITTLPGFTPAEGDSFVIVKGSSVTGNFDDIVGSEIGGGLHYAVQTTPTTVVLGVASRSLSIGNATTDEGGDAVFTVSLTPADPNSSITVGFATADGTATDPADYDGQTGTLTFAPNETAKTITVPTVGDSLDEATETFTATLSNASGATIADGVGAGQITDDDPEPQLSIANVSVTEGNTGTTDASFVVTLSSPSGRQVTVDFATQDGTATAADNDFETAAGKATFAPGDVSETITVKVNGDVTDEADETFGVVLSNAVNAAITTGAGTGTGTIVDDDIALNEADLAVSKTDSPDPVGLSRPLTYRIDVFNHGPAQALNVEVTDDLPNGVELVSATPSSDGTCVTTSDPIVCSWPAIDFFDFEQVTIVITTPGAPTTLSNRASVSSTTPDFVAGNNVAIADTQVAAEADLSLTKSAPARVLVGGDLTYTLAIRNNGPDPAASVEVSDPLPAGATLVSMSTTAGTCTGEAVIRCELGSLPKDALETVTIVVRPSAAGALSNTATVASPGADANPGNNTSTATTTVESPPELRVSNGQVTEGDAGQVDITFDVTLSGASPTPVTVDFATADGTATSSFADPSAGAGFVTRAGNRLFLGGVPYRFTGLNIYNANSNGLCWYEYDAAQLDSTLAAIGAMGGKGVIRAWFFQQLATSSGARDWTAFDRTLDRARAHGFKVIATLIDQWGNCGSLNPAGAYKDEAWYTSGYKDADPVGTVSYRDWVAEVVGRYKDDPAILAWEPVNEAEVKPSGDSGCSVNGGQTLRMFMADVTGLIKAIDPNHLVSSGVLGGGQCATQSSDYQDLHALATIDLCSYHDYIANAPMPGDEFNGLQKRLDQCAELDKPVIVGEAGIIPNDVDGTLAGRARAFHAKLLRQIPARVAGFVPWAWNREGSSLMTFDIGPDDPVLSTLANFGDYDSAAGSRTFAPGETTKTVTVKVNGDLLDELDETFFLRLLNPVDATIADGEGIGTILDDDAEPSISIDDVSVSEGNTGTRTARFTVALSAPSGKTITVAFATASATATAGGDYVSTNGTLTVAPGQASKNVDVTVNGDTVVEADETYHVNLTAPSNATVADGDGLGTITNDDANRAPVLAPVGDQIVQAGEILVVPISATDPDGDAITLSASNLPPFASLTDDGDGTGHLRLAPSLPDVGTYLGVVVSASDSSGADTVTIKITVKPPPPPGPPNNPPYAVDDVASARGAPVEIAVLANDSDVDGDNLSIVEVVQPQHGGVTCGSSRCTYTPSPGFSGPSDTFTYTASDGRGGTAKARVVVRIRANKSPIALDDEAMTHGTKAQMIRVLLNDLDPEGDTLTVSPFGPGPSHGTVSCVSSGCWYAAAAGFTGDDTFAYQISDGHGGEATATVRVTVEVNQKPTAQDDAALAHGLGSVAISVLVNDFDPDGDELSIVNVGQPQLGSVTCGVTCTYTPPTTPPVGGYPFTATFTYAISDGLADEQPPATVSVLVLENHAPMAVDDRMTAPAVDPGFEASGTLAPLGNDYDVDGDVLDIVDWTQPEEGGGSVVCYHPPFRPWLCDYTAQPGFLGDDSFTYTITDYHGKAATATIDVTVLPNRPPEARPDAGVAHGSGEVRLDVLGNDSDPDSDPLVVVDNTQATIGSVECASDGCTFVPPAGYDGPYPQTTKFSYTVGDGRGGTAEAEVEVTLIANQPPVAADDRASTRFPKEVVISVTGNDVDPDGDALRVISLTPLVPFRGGVSCAADRCTYRPPSNFSGSESFRYTITDDHGNGTSSATVTVRVLGENHAPDALDDDVTASTSSNTRILLLGNDRDLDEDPFRLIDWSDATGTVDCSDRACIYTPAEGAADGSEDSFTYTITDDLGGYDTATVHIVVHENQPPVAVADVFEGTIDHKATVNVVANDDDPEHDPLLIVRKTGGAHGSVYCGDTCTYTLDPAYAGPIPVTDTFTYTITDGKADHQSTASVSVTLNANRPPVARDDEATAHGSAPLLLALLGNDTDDDRDPLSIVAVTSPNVGCNVALVCRYAAPPPPPAGYPFDETFQYTISDGHGHTATARVTIHVVANSPPTARDDVAATRSGTSIVIGVLGNDDDFDQDPFVIVESTPAAHGTVTCPLAYPSSSSCSYTSADGYEGSDSFTYTIADSQGGRDSASVSIEVGPANHAVVAVDDPVDVYGTLPTTINVLGNDLDADHDPLRIIEFSPQAPELTDVGGSVFCTPASCRYTPPADYTGPFPLSDSFTYAVTDGRTRDDAVVRVTVRGNRAPVAVGDEAQTHGAPVAVNVLKNDSDPDGDALVELTPDLTGTVGSVSCDSLTGYCDYTPQPGFVGADTFRYLVTDSRGASSSATVTVDVVGNKAPIAKDDFATVTGTTPEFINVRSNDRDPDGDFLSVMPMPATHLVNGTAECFADGCTYAGDSATPGVDSFQYTVTDGHGGEAVARVTINGEEPLVSIGISSSPNPSLAGQSVIVTASVLALDDIDRTGTVTFEEGGTILGTAPLSGGVATLSVDTLAVGSHAITARYSGQGVFAGETAVSAVLTHVVHGAASATSLDSDPSPSPLGQAVTFTSVVTARPPGTGTPTGMVTFRDGSEVLGTAPLDVGRATLVISTLSIGSHAITATYEGSDGFAPSTSGSLTHVVEAGVAVAIVSDAPDPSVRGQVVTVGYSVVPLTPGAGTPTGDVTVSDGVNSCTATVADGQCSLVLTTVGQRTLTAVYSGDGGFAGATSAGESHTVNEASTSTSITSDVPDPSVRGQAVIVSFSVVPVVPGAGTPSGNVTVGDGVDSCNATVAAGQCSLVLTTVGQRTLTAVYAGGGGFSGSTSASEPHTVNEAATSTAITSDLPDPSLKGQAVTVSFSVVPVVPGAGTPSGDVTVGDGVDSCNVTVAAGQCSLVLTTAGQRTLTAVYAGGGGFEGSTSPGEPHTVNRFDTTTSITSDAPDPSAKGQAVPVTFTVAAAGGTGTPSGNVTVGDGVDSCTATVAAGQCSLTMTTGGSRTLTASYAGDGDFNGSTSAGEPHTVTRIPTTTSITADTPDPSVTGQSVTVRYTVLPTQGAGTPTGNVTVSDGSASCIATVAAGACDITLRTSGSKTLTATYEGDADFVGSTSAGETHAVNRAATTTTITADTPDPSARGQTVTVGFNVTVGPGTGTPTGNVTVGDGVDSCTATVAAGQCSLAFTTVGQRTLTAVYAGDSDFNDSTSAGGPHTVNKAATTIAITADSPDPSSPGQAVTVNYSVAVVSPGSGTPTGNVTVGDGVDSCTGTVAAGQCSLTLTTAGNRTLTASYAGDAGFEGSTSAGVAHVVQQMSANLRLSVSASTASPALGNDFSYTIVVTNLGPSTAAAVTVRDTLPGALHLISATTGCGGTPVTCSLGDIAPGGSRTIVLLVEGRFDCDFVGTSGNDTDAAIGSSAGADVICGGGGDDTFSGGDGNDRLYGLAPDGMLPAGVSNSAHAESTTPDPVTGNNDASASVTVVTGTDGEDRLSGNGGDDTINGGARGDAIFGGPDNDAISGDSSNTSGGAADELHGGAGNDAISGSDGADTIDGDGGSDRLNGGDGGDTINGGDGADVIQGVYGHDTLSGNAGNDEMWGDSQSTESGGSGAGNDTMNGNAGNDEMHGQDGGDTMRGGDGSDALFGWTGPDTLHGGLGIENLLNCGTGTDKYSFDPTRDVRVDCETLIKP